MFIHIVELIPPLNFSTMIISHLTDDRQKIDIYLEKWQYKRMATREEKNW